MSSFTRPRLTITMPGSDLLLEHAAAGTKKTAWLASTAGLVSARRGLDLTCKPSWLAKAQHLSERWSPQYPVLLLGQNQLAQTCRAQLVGFPVVHDADMRASLQQRVASNHPL